MQVVGVGVEEPPVFADGVSSLDGQVSQFVPSPQSAFGVVVVRISSQEFVEGLMGAPDLVGAVHETIEDALSFLPELAFRITRDKILEGLQGTDAKGLDKVAVFFKVAEDEDGVGLPDLSRDGIRERFAVNDVGKDILDVDLGHRFARLREDVKGITLGQGVQSVALAADLD